MREGLETKNEKELKSTNSQIKIIGIAISLFITLANNILAITITKTTEMEKWSTKTRHNIMLATKLAIA
jgi:hypothetical protein